MAITLRTSHPNSMRRPTPLLLVLLLATAAGAQPAPETVDADVLYGFLGIEDPAVLVTGGLPGPELEALLPRGTTMVAVLSRPSPLDEGERYSTVLGRVDAPRREAAEAYAPPEGWSEPDPYEPDPYGFVPNKAETQDETQFLLCPNDSGQVAQVEFSERPGGGAYVRVSRFSTRYSPCGPRPENPRPLDLQELEKEVPTLIAPEGTRLRRTGGGGGMDDREQSAELEGDLSLADVADHYGNEMERAGWTRRGASVEPDLAVSTWTRESDDGLLVLMLTARPDGPSSYDLRLSMLAPTRE